MDPYKILGVDRNASEEDIKKAYRKLAKEYHPDRCSGDPEAQKKFIEIQQAYEKLTKPQPEESFNPFDIFFGSGFNQFQRQRRGRDIHFEHSVSFIEAAVGAVCEASIQEQKLCSKCSGLGCPADARKQCRNCNGSGMINYKHGNVHISSTCKNCQGRGFTAEERCSNCHGGGQELSERKIKFTVPEGIRDGDSVRLRGQGEMIPNGEAGDAFVIIRVRAHDKFNRDGNDLIITISVLPSQMYLGREIEVEHLRGKEKITIKEEPQRITNLGLKDPKSNYRGDLVVKFIVKCAPQNEDLKKKYLELEELEKSL